MRDPPASRCGSINSAASSSSISMPMRRRWPKPTRGSKPIFWPWRLMRPARRAHVQDFPLAANWKNSVENYCECYHCPNQHPSLVDAALDISRYKINIHHNYHRHVTTDVGDAQGYAMADSGQGEENFGSWLLWPNMVFEVYPGGNLTRFTTCRPGLKPACRKPSGTSPATDRPPRNARSSISSIPCARRTCRSAKACSVACTAWVTAAANSSPIPGASYVSEHAVHDFQRHVAAALDLEQ